MLQGRTSQRDALVTKVVYPADINRHLLSAHLSAYEIECPCCKKILICDRFINAFEATRARLGHPITFTSGVRCQKYQRYLYEQINAKRRLRNLEPIKIPKVGFHVTGEAGDSLQIIVPGEVDSDEEKEYIEKLREDGWVGIGIQKERKNSEGKIIQIGWTHGDVRMSAHRIWRYGYGR